MACSSEGAMDRRLNQYQKICRLYEISKLLENLGKQNQIFIDLDSTCGIIPVGNFMEVADFNNIHMWLSNYMDVAECCFAKACITLLEQGICLNKIKEIMFQQGEEDVYCGAEELKSIYAYLDFNILDGMPCDEKKEVISVTDNEIVWVKKVDMHEFAWLNSIDIYYVLLGEYIKGILSKTKVVFENKENVRFTLKKVDL